MTEQSAAAEDSNYAHVEPGDWFLQFLVRHVNDTGLEFGVTLHIGGTLVTGQLVKGADYFDAFSNQFAAGFGDSAVGDSYRAALASAGDIYRTVPTEEEDDRAPAQFIHLKDARFFTTPGDPVLSAGMWWRGRISQITGFSLGELRVSS